MFNPNKKYKVIKGAIFAETAIRDKTYYINVIPFNERKRMFEENKADSIQLIEADFKSITINDIIQYKFNDHPDAKKIFSNEDVHVKKDGIYRIKLIETNTFFDEAKIIKKIYDNGKLTFELIYNDINYFLDVSSFVFKKYHKNEKLPIIVNDIHISPYEDFYEEMLEENVKLIKNNTLDKIKEDSKHS